MPRGSGIDDAAALANSGVSTDSVLAVDTNLVAQELTNLLFQAFLQLDPVETFCTTESGNAMTVPEWATTAIDTISFVGVVGGIFVAVGIGVFGWLRDAASKGTGTGGGKKYIALGLGMIAAGTLVYSIPSIAEQGYTGAEACFALIRPMIETPMFVR